MKGIYYNDLPEEYPQGYVRPKMDKPYPKADDEVDENLEGTFKERLIWYHQEFSDVPASGFNVPSGTEVEYELQPTWYKNCDRSVPTLDDIKDFAIPSKAVEGNNTTKNKASMNKAKWMAFCLEIGLVDKSQLDQLADVWDKFKDEYGNMKPPTNPPVTDKQQERLYTPEEVVQIVEDAFESAAQYAYNVAMGLEQTEPNRNQYVDDLKKKMGIE